MIISYFVYDTPTLLHCSRTCRSWNAAAKPHLFYSLTTYAYTRDYKKYQWPAPLTESSGLDLLQHVQRLRIREWDYLKTGLDLKFSLERFGESTLQDFLKLTNLQHLQIQKLQLSSFMPKIQQYFGHFAPSLKRLCLEEPTASCHQLLYFIGLFPRLQNLILINLSDEVESAADSALVPPSTPDLCGLLVLMDYSGEELIKCMIKLFGGLRFRHMNLEGVKCTRLLLEACAKTLETLRLNPTDTCNQEFIQNGEVYPLHSNLSKNTSLRTLEIEAGNVTVASYVAPNFLTTLLATITSPLLLDVVVIYREREVGCHVTDGHNQSEDSPTDHAELFRIYSEMHSVRNFRLVLCAEVLKCDEEAALEALERCVEEEAKDGGFDYLGCRPLIISRVGGALWAGTTERVTCRSQSTQSTAQF